MARVSAHGQEIGTVEYLTKAKRYMSDGVLLKNYGFGWKIGGKVKAEFTPQQAFQAAKDNLERRLREYPAFAQYRTLLHDAAGLSKRWKLHAAIEMMPNDCDGVWSEACDGYGDNCTCSVDEIGDLCRAYQTALQESDSLRKEHAA